MECCFLTKVVLFFNIRIHVGLMVQLFANGTHEEVGGVLFFNESGVVF